MRRGDVRWINDYQGMGECLVCLEKRIGHDIEGSLMPRPIWSCHIIASNKEGFMEFYAGQTFEPCHAIDIFEYRLIQIN